MIVILVVATLPPPPLLPSGESCIRHNLRKSCGGGVEVVGLVAGVVVGVVVIEDDGRFRSSL